MRYFLGWLAARPPSEIGSQHLLGLQADLASQQRHPGPSNCIIYHGLTEIDVIQTRVSAVLVSHVDMHLQLIVGQRASALCHSISKAGKAFGSMYHNTHDWSITYIQSIPVRVSSIFDYHSWCMLPYLGAIRKLVSRWHEVRSTKPRSLGVQ